MADTKTEAPVDDRLNEALARSLPYAPLAVVGGAIALGLARGPGAAVLTLAGGALVGAIAAMWNSLRVLSGEAPLSLHEAIDLGAPSAHEEQKTRVLLAIKDLKREHAIGKISDEDFADLMARYRAEASRLLHQVDADFAPARERAEALLAARLAGKPDEPTEDGEESDEPAPVVTKKKGKKKGGKAEPPPSPP